MDELAKSSKGWQMCACVRVWGVCDAGRWGDQGNSQGGLRTIGSAAQ